MKRGEVKKKNVCAESGMVGERAVGRIDGSQAGRVLSPPNGHARLSHIMHAQQYKSAKGLHP